MDEEEWRPVVGLEDRYEVSDHGRVRSMDRVIPVKGKDGTRRYKGRLRSPGIMKSGHRNITLGTLDGPVSRLIHHLVLEAFIGPRPKRFWGCHKDDDPSNNHISNLRWDTPRSNILDTVRLGNNRCRQRGVCPAGHLLQAPNLVASFVRKGHRACLACARTRATIQAQQKAGRLYDVAMIQSEHYARIMAPSTRDRTP